jgi:hypothetical protein
MTRRRTRRTLKTVVIVAAVATASSAAAVATGFDLSKDETTAESQSSVPAETAKVTKETLVDTQVVTGELSYGDSTTVSSGLGGTVTKLPVVGATLTRGSVLYRVDDTPIVLLYGTLPAYRTLQTDVEGADVKQFEQNLRAMGYDGFTVDDEYTSATANAAQEWQEDLGLEETGTVQKGRVTYAAGPVRVNTVEVEVGAAAKDGEAIFTHTGSSRVVAVELEASQQKLAVKNSTVSLELPNGKTISGKVSKVKTVVETTAGEGANAEDTTETKFEVTVAITDKSAVAGLEQASVQVGFTAAKRENVLTVPVAALLALAEGGYGVQVVDGTTTKTVAVKTGMFAKGRVEVTGTGLAAGQTVGMPG